VNLDATRDYIDGLKAGKSPVPPVVIIELYLDETEETEILRGSNNLLGEDACGVRIQAKLAAEYAEEYERFVADPKDIRLVPTEYYRVEWHGFCGNAVTSRSIPASASVIDASTIRLQSGVDHHLQQIIRTHLNVKERVELSREYRSLREAFGHKDSVKKINEKLKGEDDLLTDRALSLAIDISQGYSWENSLAAHVDDLPFQLIGKGEQNALKTLLAIGQKAAEVEVVLIEEPETHLSFTSLRKLISRIEERCAGKQIIIATHSAFVLNKLGLDNLILLGENGIATRITDLPPDTVDFFKKLPGFDTLRLVLSDSAVLVEGPSDELIVQRYYKDTKGKLPIDDGIDVISVGLSHKRFLDLAVPLKRRVRAVVDNDGKDEGNVRERFADYLTHKFVSLHVGKDPTLNTLEPQLVAANDLATLSAVLGLTCASSDELADAMIKDKTGSALAIFESTTTINMPEYIKDVFGS
jgi:predicted ATP-dependent endonuclease of OLD family